MDILSVLKSSSLLFIYRKLAVRSTETQIIHLCIAAVQSVLPYLQSANKKLNFITASQFEMDTGLFY